METLEKTATGARRTWRTGFFTIMSGVVLLLVVIGFVPTFYLRPIFDVPPIPAYLYLHGLIMTIWFVWFVGQSFLVSAGLVTRHRQFGTLGTIFGVVG